MDNESQQNEQSAGEYSSVAPEHQTAPATEPNPNSAIRTVEKISAWVLIFTAILFALIAIAAIWGAFGNNSSAAWKSAASLGVVAITALVVNVGTRIYEGKRK